jgi:cytochrome c-type biogenesis protein CcsB
MLLGGGLPDSSLLAFPDSGVVEAEEEKPAEEHVHMNGVGAPIQNGLGETARARLGQLSIQDYQGRMKPLDTLSREMVMKVTKRSKFEGWEPLDLYLSWISHSGWWLDQPLIAVRNPGVKELLGVGEETTHVSIRSLIDEYGRYRYGDQVEEALRTPNRERSKVQRKLLTFDERFNIFVMSMQGRTLRIFPVPGDEKGTWLSFSEVSPQLDEAQIEEYHAAYDVLSEGVSQLQSAKLLAAADAIAKVQEHFGADVLPSETALKAEMSLNRMKPFLRVIPVYLLGFFILLAAYVIVLARRKGKPYTWKHPLYLVGMLVFVGATLYHLYGFVLRWVASGRAPLSNGYESLVFISLTVAIAGVIFEFLDRRGISAALASLLTAVVLGVSLLSTFDPAIGPLVPVLASYWLNIHVTVITSSYGFLGLGALLALTMLILHLFKGPNRPQLHDAVKRLNLLHWNVLVTGLGLLTIGTLLGGVWANESWGRYWGWDSKETWSLVTILVYAVVIHFRWIPALNRAWVSAAASFAAISSVIMTYFGVNYFLVGLHSYGGGDAVQVPSWVAIGAILMSFIILVSGWFDMTRKWSAKS